MEIRQLEYFHVIAAFQNLTKAAEALHITQPALSRILKRLEDDLGFELFERHKSRITLSPAGEVFLTASLSALETLNRGIYDCRHLLGTADDLVRCSALYEGVADEPFRRFHEAYPSVRIQQSLLPMDTMQQRLLARELDFAIAPNLFTAPEIIWTPLISEELLLILPPTHPLSGRTTISLEEFNSLRFAFNEAVYDLESFERICAEHDLHPELIFQSNQHTVISSYVNMVNGDCALFVPSSYFLDLMRATEQSGELSAPMPTRIEPHVFYREIGLASLDHATSFRARDEYMHYVRQYYTNLDRELDELLKKTFR